MFLVLQTNSVIAATFDYFGINHSIYEDGRDVYRISFTISDGSGKIYNQNIINSLGMSGASTVYNTDNVKFWTGDEYLGLYNDASNEIDYDPTANYVEYHGPVNGICTNGEYKLTANVTPPGLGSETIQISKQWNYSPVSLPVVSSTSFQLSNDSTGNLIFKWDAPTGLNNSTNSRITIEVSSNDSFIGEIYVRVPTDLGQILVPAQIVQDVEEWGGDRYEFMVNIRTNTGIERTYSNKRILYSLTNLNTKRFPWNQFLPSITRKQ